jgi:23S rRNA pseudouridine955/2504/2580 synthase
MSGAATREVEPDVPPLDEGAVPPVRPRAEVAPADATALQARVLYRDETVIVIDKPPGLAVQGGSRTHRHLDAMLDALAFAGDRPRLVHRLDKDTSGVLVLARSRAAAAHLAAAFRRACVHKLYWALVAGLPRPAQGRIEVALAKRPAQGGEKVVADEAGRPAATRYRVIEAAGRRAAWLALEPEGGRTHQLRVHCRSLGTPIVGDGKYGGAQAFPRGAAIGRGLHLHARAIQLPHPGGGQLAVTAPLPPHMVKSWLFFGFDPEGPAD